MITDYSTLMFKLSNYASPKSRITRLIKNRELIHIKRGIYIDNENLPYQVLSPLIYGPSYLSFQYALSVYGLIPERVNIYMSASYNKNKDKVFKTPVGNFHYLYLPAKAYPYGICLLNEGGYNYLQASVEKALCDSIYKVSGIANFHDIENLIYEDFRIEHSDVINLDNLFISNVAPMYSSKALSIFAKWLSGVRRG